MHGPGDNFHRNYQQDIDTLIHGVPACQAPTYPSNPQDPAWMPPTSSPAPRLSRTGASPATRATGTISPRSSIPAGRSRCHGFAAPMPNLSSTAGATSAAAERQAPALAGARHRQRRTRHRRDQRGHSGAPDHRGRRGRSNLERTAFSTGWSGATASGASSSGPRSTKRTGSIRSSRRQSSTP